jgi:nucleotide-binding universal stress UspA family protein
MIKTILVPATGTEGDAAVFASALAAARPFAAHLDFLHVRIDATAMAVSMATDGGGAAMIGGLVEQLDAEADQREQRAKEMFDGFCRREGLALKEAPDGQPGLSAQWLRDSGGEADKIAEYGRCADLIVIGRPAGADGVAMETVEGALIESGRPLFVPPAAPLAALPGAVAIAWNGTREAARAVGAAMPFLGIAREIVILTVAEEERVSGEAAARLMAALRWHGVPVSTRHLDPAPPGAADTLLAAAAEQGALLVMGGYGHSRLREWIFGGFTRRVLQGAEVPVLMAH